jgi:type VI secretion system protein ImpK
MTAEVPPSLFGMTGNFGRGPLTAHAAVRAHLNQAAVPAREPRDLMDLLYDGFYMLFLLRNGAAPSGEPEFRERLRSFLTTFERGAQRLQASADDQYMSKFAFCALVDETILMSRLSVRDAWERKPLQLELFGEQLAGDRFYDHLEKLRQEGAPRIQVLEVFHMCLLLGFQGRYVLEGSEKLSYLTARLGDEIASMRGKRAAFAPHWMAPDAIAHKLRTEVPLWVIASVFALVGLLAYLGLSTVLTRQTDSELARYSQVVKLAPPAANVTITLP